MGLSKHALLFILFVGSRLVAASFQAEPLATQAANITERPALETGSSFDEANVPCQAILIQSTEDAICGVKGSVTARGIVPINMWFVVRHSSTDLD